MLIEKIFIDHSLCAGHGIETWKYKSEKNRPLGVHGLSWETDTKVKNCHTIHKRDIIQLSRCRSSTD